MREYIKRTGCLDNDTVTQALLAHADTPCKVLGKSPDQLAYGRRQKHFFRRSADALKPVPGVLLSAAEKKQKQMEIRQKAGKRLDLHIEV